MPILTIEAIRENPWNVVEHELPTRPEELLLEVAYLAADYCRRAEFLLMEAARERRYVPPGWEPVGNHEDVHEENEGRSVQADFKLQEICDLCEKEYGVFLDR